MNSRTQLDSKQKSQQSIPLIAQLREAFIESPKTLSQLTRATALPLAIYFLCALIVFGIVAIVLINNEDLIRKSLLSYLLPESWHGISEYLINFFFESQTKVVFAGLIVSGSLVVASVLLFPLKEYCSARFAKDRYQLQPDKEFPLWLQGLEEIKLLVLYVAAQSIILAVGYYPFVWTKILSSTLSIAFLFFSFGLDFISPTLQRHRVKYSQILNILSRNTLLTFSFGCLFSLPILLIAKLILTSKELSLVEMSSVITLLNLIFLTFAIPAGTRIAHTLLPIGKSYPPVALKTKQRLYGAVISVFIIGTVFHSHVALSLHRKSQILKCEYDVQWSSIDVKLPSFSALKKGETKASLSLNVNITNPTPFPLELEKSFVTIKQNEKVISTTAVSYLLIEPQQSVRQQLLFNSAIDATNLSNFTKLHKGWSIHVEYKIWPGIPFIVKVL